MSVLWEVVDVIKATGGVSDRDWCACRVEIDSRKIQVGDLFVAIKGDNFDGHDYVEDAFARGAVAAMVSRKLDVEGNQILVVDTLEALDDLGEYNRARSNAKIIGITGSVGKTSTKEMLKLALAAHGKVYATIGNYNNHIGTPLSLANLPLNTEFAVFEMGMNHVGEISHLTNMVRPNIALVTGVEAVHLEFFFSVDEIAMAKAEIFEGLENVCYPALVAGSRDMTSDLICGSRPRNKCGVTEEEYGVTEEEYGVTEKECGVTEKWCGVTVPCEDRGVAVINADQVYFKNINLRSCAAHAAHLNGASPRIARPDDIIDKISFGENEKADCRLLAYNPSVFGCEVLANIMGEELKYKLAATGRHWAVISSSVLAVIYALGLDVKKSALALAEFAEVEGRGQVEKIAVKGGEFLLINDSYNASPVSMNAAFVKTNEVWEIQGKKGRKIAVLGDMFELGEKASELHAELAENLLEQGFDKVYLAGKLMRYLHDAIPQKLRGGYAKSAIELLPMVDGVFAVGDVVLVKGSHGSRIYEIADILKKEKLKDAV